MADEVHFDDQPARPLSYRAPRDDPPASAGDVLRGAVASAVLIVLLAAVVGLVWLAWYRNAISVDPWGPAEWTLFFLIALLIAAGALAAGRSVQYYLTGRHRRRLAAPGVEPGHRT